MSYLPTVATSSNVRRNRTLWSTLQKSLQWTYYQITLSPLLQIWDKDLRESKLYFSELKGGFSVFSGEWDLSMLSEPKVPFWGWSTNSVYIFFASVFIHLKLFESKSKLSSTSHSDTVSGYLCGSLRLFGRIIFSSYFLECVTSSLFAVTQLCLICKKENKSHNKRVAKISSLPAFLIHLPT